MLVNVVVIFLAGLFWTPEEPIVSADPPPTTCSRCCAVPGLRLLRASNQVRQSVTKREMEWSQAFPLDRIGEQTRPHVQHDAQGTRFNTDEVPHAANDVSWTSAFKRDSKHYIHEIQYRKMQKPRNRRSPRDAFPEGAVPKTCEKCTRKS